MRSIPLNNLMGGAVLGADAKRAFAWSRPDAWVWDMESGELLQTFTHPDFHGGLRGGAANPEAARFLTWNTNNTIGEEVELTSDTGSVWVWDAAQGEPLHTLHHDGWVNSAVFSADGSRVLSASEDNTARLWDTETGKLLHAFPHEGDAGGAVFAPGEARVLTWGGGSPAFRVEHDAVHLWDATSGKLVQTFPQPGATGAKFNADGTHVLSWGGDKASLWDINSDRPLATFSQRTDGVRFMSFQVDVPWIVVGDECDAALAATLRMVWRNVEHASHVSFRAPGARQKVLAESLTRACALFDFGGSAELHSSRLDGPVSILGPAGHRGAVFDSDESRLLTWGPGLQVWNLALRDERPIEQQLLDHEFRTATRLDETGRVRVLSVDEWRELNRQPWD
jgi:WD40 repeat protein